MLNILFKKLQGNKLLAQNRRKKRKRKRRKKKIRGEFFRKTEFKEMSERDLRNIIKSTRETTWEENGVGNEKTSKHKHKMNSRKV